MTALTALFVESNTTGTGAVFVERCVARGWSAALVTRDPSRYPWAEEVGASTVIIDTSDPSVVLQEVLRLVDKPVMVWSSSERFIATAAELAFALQLPGPDARAVALARSKIFQRKSLRMAGLLQPNVEVVRSTAELEDALIAVKGTSVVKPASGTGSAGVKICATPEEVAAQAVRLLASNQDGSGAVMIEEYLMGCEYSVEIFHGVAVAVVRKHLSDAPYCVEVGHDAPAALSDSVRSEMVGVAERAARTLGLTWGPVHVEIRMTPIGAAVVEVNPRLAGGYIPELVAATYGIDLIDATIDAASGRLVMPLTLTAPRRFGAIRFVIHTGDTSGLPSDERSVSGVDAKWYPWRGPVDEDAHDFSVRVGHALAVRNSGAAARGAAERAVAEMSQRLSIHSYRGGYSDRTEL